MVQLAQLFIPSAKKYVTHALFSACLENKYKSVSQFEGNSSGEKEECWDNFVLRDGGRCDVQPKDENESDENW